MGTGALLFVSQTRTNFQIVYQTRTIFLIYCQMETDIKIGYETRTGFAKKKKTTIRELELEKDY